MPNRSYNNGNTDSRFKFTGQELDQELDINLYYFGARYYDPQLGRWHVVDPADEFNSPFEYVGNLPTRLIGPDGMGSDGNKRKIKKELKITKDGKEITIKVSFQDTSSDKKSSDNEVTNTLANVVEGAIKDAASETDITSVTITATTNGEHSATSRHYSGKAVDIGAVNGKSVTSIGDNNPVKALQKAFENQTGRRENFGPSMMKKSGKEYIHNGLSTTKLKAKETIKKQHQNHIHWSVE